MDEEIIDLEAIIEVLAEDFPDIAEIYLFGSRRFETGSSRSDIDILITTTSRIKPSQLRDFTLKHSTALDLFILENGRATSVANESYIEASSNDKLVKDVNALLLYDKDTGASPELAKKKQIEIDKRINHELTSLPNSTIEYIEEKAFEKFLERANENGLTAKPYIGASTEEASEFIVEILRGLVPSTHSVTNHGQAKVGWTKNLNDEYDFQNLFWIVVKPWLPSLSREDVQLKYDGQEKRSDFNLFNSQMVIEMKHIKNDGDKRSIVKTLSGLKGFYVQHPNIRTLIFAILVDESVDLDDRKWESDFTFSKNTPEVKTVIIRNKIIGKN
ncbi:nucleotidyltransferase domain-containing protein [Flagellimonas allohymeniacidonis]|uniref:Nucleotidyltransferase domain-containing protein n=1 Tax=Flagellimonas allohymeniacidonis TaxID=2517819 RepID=A0A4Q8QGG3_9FLAO|nr:nucleotidyltransferase domain-containing protein [Allomuricauda hymeniacidonis]TAI49635.1 nucleotidyltransferase domain-containing protein [Allomuricauda hymeniacidonis]